MVMKDDLLPQWIARFKQKLINVQVGEEQDVQPPASYITALGPDISPAPAIGNIFIHEQYSLLAEDILQVLDVKSLIRCSMVCKNLNTIISHSSPLQLKLRYAYHQYPLPLSSSFSTTPSSTGEKLQTLISTERNIHHLNPRKVYTIPTERNSYFLMFQDHAFTGFLGTGNDDNVRSASTSRKDWHMWNLDHTDGPKKVISGDYDYTVLGKIMVVKYNLMVHVTRAPTTNHIPSGNTFRIHFYLLVPPESSSDESSATRKWEPIYHPEAKHPYIDIGDFPQDDLYSTPMLAGGVTDNLLFSVGVTRTPRFGWVGVLDWRKGTFLACISSNDQWSTPYGIDLLGEDILVTASAEVLPQEIPPGTRKNRFKAEPVSQPCFIVWAVDPNMKSSAPRDSHGSWKYEERPKFKPRSVYVIPTSKQSRYTTNRKANQEECYFALNWIDFKSRSLSNFTTTSYNGNRDIFMYEQGLFGFNLVGELWSNTDNTFQDFVFTNAIIDFNLLEPTLDKEPKIKYYNEWKNAAMVWYDLAYDKLFFDMTGWKSLTLHLKDDEPNEVTQMDSQDATKIKRGTLYMRDFHPAATSRIDRAFRKSPIGALGNDDPTEQQSMGDLQDPLEHADVDSDGNALTDARRNLPVRVHSQSRFKISFSHAQAKAKNNDPGEDRNYLRYTETTASIDIDLQYDSNGIKNKVLSVNWDGKRMAIRKDDRVEFVYF